MIQLPRRTFLNYVLNLQFIRMTEQYEDPFLTEPFICRPKILQKERAPQQFILQSNFGLRFYLKMLLVFMDRFQGTF